ncbi:conserved hypothetical protein [Xenorhabdus nematophila F1]|nr:conserved hypothetical protein [Xenorhabdus nematophila F1]
MQVNSLKLLPSPSAMHFMDNNYISYKYRHTQLIICCHSD